MKLSLPRASELASRWPLDPDVVYLNHGSFGACPQPVLDRQQEYRQRLEKEPVRFLVTDLEGLLDQSREKVAGFVHADPGDVAFVQNATAAVNAVFRSIRFNPGDEILFTGHLYGACRQLLEFISDQTGARLVEATYPFPIDSPGTILEAVLGKVTPRTRIALIDHISSATALIHPVDEIVRELDKRGIDTMIDGAHGVGCIPLDLEKTGAAYYTTNCHKWLCTPKSSAILHVRKDRQKGVYPMVVSHAGYKAEPFPERFFWPGTWDPTPALCAGDAIDYLESLVEGGWPALMERNHNLCLEARKLICNNLGIGLPCPDSMIASMASIPLPLSPAGNPPDYKSYDPFQVRLLEEHHIEIPVWHWSNPPVLMTRISVQLYNSPEQYRYLSGVLAGMTGCRP